VEACVGTKSAHCSSYSLLGCDAVYAAELIFNNKDMTLRMIVVPLSTKKTKYILPITLIYVIKSIHRVSRDIHNGKRKYRIVSKTFTLIK
jgi:hypothetical protein